MGNIKTIIFGASSRACGLLAALSIFALAFGQSSPKKPAGTKADSEVSTNDAPTTFGTRVYLAPVRVVVRNQSGNAIGTLQKDDFQLFDRGKPQVISRFSLEKTGATGAQIPSEDGIESKDPKAPPPRPLADRFVAFVFDDLHFSSSGDANAFALANAIKAAHTHLAEVVQGSGRAAIYTTSGLDQIDFTGDAAKLHETLDRIRPRVRNLGEPDTRLTLLLLRNVVRRISAMPGQRSIVLVSSGFLIPDEDRFNVLDARGVYVVLNGDASQSTASITSASPNGVAQGVVAAAQSALSTAQLYDATLGEIAYGTGGTFIHNTNDLEDGFRRIAVPPEYVYVLGFSPQNLKYDGSYHTLKVSLKNPAGLTILARHGYSAPRRETDPAAEAKQAIEEALYSRDEIRDIPSDLHLQFFKSSDTAGELTVVAKVDVRQFRFRKDEGRNKDTLTLVAGLFDRNGNFITAMQKVVEMKLHDETLANRLGFGITVRSDFPVTPGGYVVRLVLRDSEGQMMSALNGAVEIP